MPAGVNDVANGLAITPSDAESREIPKFWCCWEEKILLGSGEHGGGGMDGTSRRQWKEGRTLPPTCAFLLSLGPVTETTLDVYTVDASFVQLDSSLDWFCNIHDDAGCCVCLCVSLCVLPGTLPFVRAN